jgi:hypothetical protein
VFFVIITATGNATTIALLVITITIVMFGCYHNLGHRCYYSINNQQSKHQNYKRTIHDSISFTTKKDTLSSKTIIRIIEKLNLERFFKTDSLRRLYDWQNISTHKSIRTDDYLLWFVCERTALEILAAFNANSKHYRDQILEELQHEEEKQIK